jgi:hypothetical protein
MTSAEHTKFRSTTRWREFRTHLLEERGFRCELCGTKKKKGLQIHHLDPEHYLDLTPEKFAILDSACHDLIERFATKLKGSKSKDIPNLEIWIKLLYQYLPVEARIAVRTKHGDYLSSKMHSEWEDLCRKDEALF